MQQYPLLQTKLHIPHIRPDLVSRPRLLERLSAGLDRQLTLVSAPAGFGKTTLVSEWVASFSPLEPEVRAAYLSLDKVFGSVLRGQVIEDYPDDWPYPSCLIYGETFEGNPVHSVWAYNEENAWAVLVTVYRPDPDRWIDYRVRRQP